MTDSKENSSGQELLCYFIKYDGANNFIMTRLLPYTDKNRVIMNINSIKEIKDFSMFDYNDDIRKQYKAVRNSIKRMCVKLGVIEYKKGWHTYIKGKTLYSFK